MKISAVWIAKNEGNNIARSIDSIKAVADEIVVVDTGSTDDTVAQAEKHGARIEKFEWNDDFAAARNYALDQVDGDIVIFLDADEWFEPALSADDKKVIESVFENKNINVANATLTNIDPQTGLVISQGKSGRIIRGKGVLRYQSLIHEHLYKVKGGKLGYVYVPNWQILHTGYQETVAFSKRQRNLKLLLKAVEMETDELLLPLYQGYIVREAFALEEFDVVAKHLNWLLAHPLGARQVMREYRAVGVSAVMLGIRTASVRRDQISRRQLYKKLVEPAKSAYAKNPISKIVDLYYDLHVDDNEAKLLQKLPGAVEKAEALRGGETTDMDIYMRALSLLYTKAAKASYIRGNREVAFDYATKSLQQAEGFLLTDAITQVLRCVKGLPSQDVILFLNSILGVDKPGVRDALLSNLQYEGFEDVYTYYLKKSIDAGTAKRGDYWYLMIMLGKCAEAAASAYEAREDSEAKMVQQTVFLAAVCHEDAGVFEQYRDFLETGYREMLDLFFYQRPSTENVQYLYALGNYGLIAFAAGRPLANQFLACFVKSETDGFRVQGNYYMSSGLYREFLQEKMYEPEPSERACQMWLAECNIMAGNYLQALEHLKNILEHSQLTDAWFNMLSVVAENADFDSIKEEAQELYDSYHSDYEAFVDYSDVVNTGQMIEPDTKKQRKAMAAMTEADLDAMVQAKAVPPFRNQIKILRKAADIYLEKKSFAAAWDCYRQLLAWGADDAETYGGLAQMFGQLENEELSRAMWQRAKK